MRSGQAMPPEPRPPAEEAHQQAWAADCKRPGARCFSTSAAAGIRWLSRPLNAMRSEQAMPPEPQRPPAEQAHQQARGRGSQKTRSPLFLTQPAARTRWLSHLPNAMRSEQAMPPEPQRPPAKEAHQQAQGGLQKTWSPLFQSRSRNKDRLALPPAKRDAKRASHASGATAPFSKGGAPTGAGLWRAKGPGPIVLYRFRGTEQWGFSRPAGGKSGGAGL